MTREDIHAYLAQCAGIVPLSERCIVSIQVNGLAESARRLTRQIDRMTKRLTSPAAAPDTGRRPEMATRPVPDAPRLEPLGESVPSKSLIETRSRGKRGARGTKPEQHHA